MLPERDHNNPPEVLELASGVVSDISAHMADNPVVETEESARAMKLQVDRARLCIKDLEDERDHKTEPLEIQLSAVKQRYRGPRRMLGDLLDEMLARVQRFVIAEEYRRQRIADELAAKAKEAEQAAKEAERIEHERLDDAAKGEVGINVAEVIAQADEAFDTYAKAQREALRATKETHVRIGGGFNRAIGLRAKETLSIESVGAATVALVQIGLTPDIEQAILKSARAWRKVHGKLPEGITSTTEKKL